MGIKNMSLKSSKQNMHKDPLGIKPNKDLLIYYSLYQHAVQIAVNYSDIFDPRQFDEGAETQYTN